MSAGALFESGAFFHIVIGIGWSRKHDLEVKDVA